MKRTKTSTSAAKNDLGRIVADLGPDVIRKLHRAYKLTAAAVYRRAVAEAEARLQERQH